MRRSSWQSEAAAQLPEAGLRISPAHAGRLSGAQNTLSRVPYDLLLSHLYVHGDRLVGQKRCVALNAANVTIPDSYIADCKGVSNDTQAIGGWNGPGHYEIINNYLEAAGENVLFGGSDPAILNLVPDGILVLNNHFTRPLTWRQPYADGRGRDLQGVAAPAARQLPHPSVAPVRPRTA
jgi:hypothetical protein